MRSTFRKKWPAILGSTILTIVYLIVVFADFIAPYDYREQSRTEPSAPASTIRFTNKGGSFTMRPSVYAHQLIDPLTQSYGPNGNLSSQIGFFVKGYPYKFLGVIPSDTHLFGTVEGVGPAVRVNLLGTDSLGRDRLSRLLRAMRFSLLVAPIGTVFACLIGLGVGMISGYSKWLVDSVLMGITDTVLALPSLILILAARVAFPLELPPFTAAAMLISIFAFFGWAEIARLARGLVRSTREKDFVLAAKATGATPFRILTRHIFPNIIRPVMAQALLILPIFLLSEAALSFLGVGLQEPEASLGNMLAAAADLGQLGRQPILLLSPALVIFIFVLAVRLASQVKDPKS